MKRILALLLAAALLCSCALADNISRRTTVSWTVNEDGLRQYLDMLLSYYGGILGMPDAAVDDIYREAQAVAAILNDTELTLQTNEDRKGEALSLTMRGVELLQYAVTVQQAVAECRVNLLPDTVFTLPLDPVSPYLTYQLPSINLQAAYPDMVQAAKTWLEAVLVDQANGVFDSDAFTARGTCLTYQFDDAKLTELVAALYEPLAPYLPVEYQDQVDSMNSRAAQSNEYAYRLNVVTAADGELAGFALNCYHGEDLVLTLSANAADPFEAVLTYMNGGSVCYDSLCVTVTEASAARLAAVADLSHFETDGSQAYALVRDNRPQQILHADVDLTLGKYCTLGTVKTSMEGFLGEPVTEHGDENAFYVQVNGDFVYDDRNGLDLTATTLLGEEECWTVSIKTDTAPAVVRQPVEGETAVDLSKGFGGGNSDILEAAVEKMLNALSVKMFKALPPEVLMLVLNLGIQ